MQPGLYIAVFIEHINLKIRTERNQGNRQIDKQPSRAETLSVMILGRMRIEERRKKEIIPFCRHGDAVRWRFLLSDMQFNAFQPRNCILQL